MYLRKRWFRSFTYTIQLVFNSSVRHCCTVLPLSTYSISANFPHMSIALCNKLFLLRYSEILDLFFVPKLPLLLFNNPMNSCPGNLFHCFETVQCPHSFSLPLPANLALNIGLHLNCSMFTGYQNVHLHTYT